MLTRLPRPSRFDLVLAGIGWVTCFVFTLAEGTLGKHLAWAGSGQTPLSVILAALWAVLFAAPVAYRRIDADIATLCLIPAFLLQLPSGVPHAGDVAAPMMIYAVAAYGRERYTRWWLGFGVAASLVGGISWSASDATNRWVALAVAFVTCAAIVAASWFMGMARRSRAAQAQAEVDRTEALAAERVQAAQMAATMDRQRIAREMHDIVAHSLSIIVIQADGANYIATQGPGTAEERLAQTATAVETIATTARSALAETRRLVGVLHSDEGTEMAPAASLADIEGLVQGVRDAGRGASYTVVGDPGCHPSLGPIAELTAYRIVQESLTNMLKHAGPDATASVRLTHTPAGLTIEVADDGVGPTASDGAGNGLRGMRARLDAIGGTLWTGPNPRGGYTVSAFIPTQENR